MYKSSAPTQPLSSSQVTSFYTVCPLTQIRHYGFTHLSFIWDALISPSLWKNSSAWPTASWPPFPREVSCYPLVLLVSRALPTSDQCGWYCQCGHLGLYPTSWMCTQISYALWEVSTRTSSLGSIPSRWGIIPIVTTYIPGAVGGAGWWGAQRKLTKASFGASGVPTRFTVLKTRAHFQDQMTQPETTCWWCGQSQGSRPASITHLWSREWGLQASSPGHPCWGSCTTWVDAGGPWR